MSDYVTADCPKCGHHIPRLRCDKCESFVILDGDKVKGPIHGQTVWMTCRNCGHWWRIESRPPRPR